MPVLWLRSPVDESEATGEMADITASREVLVEEAALPTAPTATCHMDNLTLVTRRRARVISVSDGDTHTLHDGVAAFKSRLVLPGVPQS